MDSSPGAALDFADETSPPSHAFANESGGIRSVRRLNRFSTVDSGSSMRSARATNHEAMISRDVVPSILNDCGGYVGPFSANQNPFNSSRSLRACAFLRSASARSRRDSRTRSSTEIFVSGGGDVAGSWKSSFMERVRQRANVKWCGIF